MSSAIIRSTSVKALKACALPSSTVAASAPPTTSISGWGQWDTMPRYSSADERAAMTPAPLWIFSPTLAQREATGNAAAIRLMRSGGHRVRLHAAAARSGAGMRESRGHNSAVIW